MDLTIRAAEPGEYAVLGEIIAEAYLGESLLDGPKDPYLLKLRAVGQRAAEAEVLVALDAHGAVLGGVTYAAPGTPWRDIAGPDEAEFRMLAVAREGRGRGWERPSCGRASSAPGPPTACGRWCCRRSRPCSQPIGSTVGSAFCGPPNGTGNRCRDYGS